MQKIIQIPWATRLVEWLRFIKENRSSTGITKNTVVVFDFRKAPFLFPYHLTSLACLVEDHKLLGATIKIRTNPKSQVGKFLKRIQYLKYWNTGFDKNYCLKSSHINILPIWKYDKARIDAFANLIERFYARHSLKGKDLSPLRLSVVEALNNISDHAASSVSGFIATQFFESRSELVISICDFGIGIPKRVNKYLKSIDEKPLKDFAALKKALEKGFSTKTLPHNRGFGLDTILSNIKASDGEIYMVSNKAYLWQTAKNNKLKLGKKDLEFAFPGTYLVIKLNTSKFADHEEESSEELNLF